MGKLKNYVLELTAELLKKDGKLDCTREEWLEYYDRACEIIQPGSTQCDDD